MISFEKRSFNAIRMILTRLGESDKGMNKDQISHSEHGLLLPTAVW